MMSNARDLVEPVRRLSRYHSSAILRKSGSSQKGLRTRKKKKKRKDPILYQPPEPLFTATQIILLASKTIEPFKSAIKPTNIIASFHDAIGISIPSVLHWMPTVLDIVFLLSYCVCKCVVACIKILFGRIFNSHRLIIGSTSSLNQRLGTTPRFMNVLVLVCLRYALASPGEANIGGGNKNIVKSLATATAVSITGILAKRTKRFKKTEQELEEMCVAKGVEYVPPELNEVTHRTRSRRRKLKDLCDPEEADCRNQKRTKTTSQGSREKHAARMRTPEKKEKTALRMVLQKTKKKCIADTYSRKERENCSAVAKTEKSRKNCEEHATTKK